MLNFKSTSATANINADPGHARLLTGNYTHSSTNTVLQPYEAVIYGLK